MKQEVINLTEGKVLFKGSGDRMTNHYIGVFNDYIKNKSNIEQSIKLHEELLKGVWDEKDNSFRWSTRSRKNNDSI